MEQYLCSSIRFHVLHRDNFIFVVQNKSILHLLYSLSLAENYGRLELCIDLFFNTQAVSRDVPGGKGGLWVRLTTYHHIVPMSRNLGALTLLDRSGPVWPVMGVLYLYLLHRLWVDKSKLWLRKNLKRRGCAKVYVLSVHFNVETKNNKYNLSKTCLKSAKLLVFYVET
jgi:hypothetical protein